MVSVVPVTVMECFVGEDVMTEDEAIEELRRQHDEDAAKKKEIHEASIEGLVRPLIQQGLIEDVVPEEETKGCKPGLQMKCPVTLQWSYGKRMTVIYQCERERLILMSDGYPTHNPIHRSILNSIISEAESAARLARKVRDGDE